MTITRADAESLLRWASEQNPGVWVDHSKTVARAAEVIAAACGLDRERAYICGLLHDIGRYEGWRDLHHVVAGYRLMMERGCGDVARICLTHSFPVKALGAYSGRNFDCTSEELALIEDELAACEFDDCDRLIQLCDSLCLPQGICLLEVRLVDVVSRHGFNDYTLRKWDAFFALKREFDARCGRNVYSLFGDEVRGVSFGVDNFSQGLPT